MLSYFVNYGCNLHLPKTSAAQWRVPFALQCIPGVIVLTGIVFQNESPRWLVEKNRIEEARTALARVRAKAIDDPDVESELQEIVEDFNGHEKMPLLGQIKATYSDRKILYRFCMAVVLMFFQQWTGTNCESLPYSPRPYCQMKTYADFPRAINYYSPQIFKSVGLASQSAGLFATGIYGVVKVTITALGLMLMTEQVGRKWSLIIGGIGQAFAMFYIGVNSAVNPVKAGAPLNGHSTFAIVCVYLFVCFYSFGWGPVPFVLAAECSVRTFTSWYVSFVLLTLFLHSPTTSVLSSWQQHS